MRGPTASPHAPLPPSSSGLPVRVAGLGAYLPSRVVTNHEIAGQLETSDEWIRSRTGILQRHVAAPAQATSDLAAAAGKAALADAGLGIEDVGTVIVATTTPDHPISATAPIVASQLGTDVAAFDVNAACSGFVYGLQLGGALAAAGGPVLLIGAEVLTRVVDPMDRAVAVLFGDGAGAAVLVRSEDAELGPFVLGTDGTDPSMLWTEAGGSRVPIDADVVDAGRHRLTMRGGDVYRHAVSRMAESAADVLARSGRSVTDVDLFVGHQANLRILEAVRSRLGLPVSRMHVTVDRHGNTSAASVPLALADARDRGRLVPGDTVLLAAFGAGLTWGAGLLTWRPTGAEGHA